MVGSLPVLGLRRAEVMGSDYSFVEVTESFRRDGWIPGDGWGGDLDRSRRQPDRSQPCRRGAGVRSRRRGDELALSLVRGVRRDAPGAVMFVPVARAGRPSASPLVDITPAGEPPPQFPREVASLWGP